MFIRTFILIAPDDGPKPWPGNLKTIQLFISPLRLFYVLSLEISVFKMSQRQINDL